jgi:hypothetical protein
VKITYIIKYYRSPPPLQKGNTSANAIRGKGMNRENVNEGSTRKEKRR